MVKLSDLSKNDLFKNISMKENQKNYSHYSSIANFVEHAFELKDFILAHGHSDVNSVARNDSNYRPLKRWITRQISKAKNNKLTVVRQEVLEQIGMNWGKLYNEMEMKANSNKQSSIDNILSSEESFFLSLDFLDSILKMEMDRKATMQSNSKDSLTIDSPAIAPPAPNNTNEQEVAAKKEPFCIPLHSFSHLINKDMDDINIKFNSINTSTLPLPAPNDTNEQDAFANILDKYSSTEDSVAAKIVDECDLQYFSNMVSDNESNKVCYKR